MKMCSFLALMMKMLRRRAGDEKRKMTEKLQMSSIRKSQEEGEQVRPLVLVAGTLSKGQRKDKGTSAATKIQKAS